MEERTSKRIMTESENNEEQSPKQNYFHKKLRSESRRFSSLILSNSISISDHKVYLKIFRLNLEKPPHQRTEEDDFTITKIINEQKMFPEFQNNSNILQRIAHNLKGRDLESGQQLFTPKTKDQHFYKILKGEVIIKNALKDTNIKGKGDYIENTQQFKIIKDIDVKCKSNCFFVLLSHQIYEWAMKIQLQNKSIMQLLSNVSLFSKFKRKQLNYLLERCPQQTFSNKHYIFMENQYCNGICYLLLEGQLAIQKNRSPNKKQVICLINQGSLIGQESFFQEYPLRFYTLSVQSSQAKLIEINITRLQETLQHFQLSSSQFLNKKYIEFIKEREVYYNKKLEQTLEMRKHYRPSRSLIKMSPLKHHQMTNLLRNIENFGINILQKQKYLEKRLQNGKTGLQEPKLISVDKPLFGRDDFPELKLAKKYNIFESKAKQNCKFPHLI